MDAITVAAAITATRGLIKGAKGVKDIARGLDDLFAAQEAEKKKGKPKTRMQQVVAMRSGEGDEAFDDDTSMGSVVSDVLEAKQLELNLRALKNEIDAKWGLGTFAAIEQERADRIERKKVRQKKLKADQKRKKEAAKDFWKKVGIESAKATAIILAVGGFVAWIFYVLEAR